MYVTFILKKNQYVISLIRFSMSILFLSLTSFVVKLVRQSILFQIKCLRRLTTFQSMSYILLGSSGLEPPTSRLSGARSNQLSYEPVWRWWDSNPWPPACRAGALPTELHPHVVFVALSFRFNELQWSFTENWTTICTLCTPIRRPSCNAVCSSP